MATEAQLVPLAPESLDEFLQLEGKIERVAEALRGAREARGRAETEAAGWKAKFQELKQEVSAQEKELISLRKEREEVRRRVEKLVEQIDSLA